MKRLKRVADVDALDRDLVSGPLVWLAIIVTTCLLLVIFQTVLWLVLPLLMAVVAYYMLSPLVNYSMSRGISRSRSVFLVTLLLCVVLIAVGLVIAPKIAIAVNSGPEKLQAYINTGGSLIKKAKTTLSSHFSFHHIEAPATPAVEDATPAPAESPGHGTDATAPGKNGTATKPPANGRMGTVGPDSALRLQGGHLGVVSSADTPAPTDEDDFGQQITAKMSEYSTQIALELLHWIPSLLLVPYMTYFFLLDGPRFKRFLVQAIPNAFFEKALYLFYRVEDQLRRYFQGLMTLTVIDATFLGIGLWVLGIGSPFFLAGLAAVMAWLPYIGSVGGGLIVVLIAAHDQPNNILLPYEVVGLFVAVRLLDDFVFMPMTIGRSLRMHPLVTVLMILLGGAVAGISGLLLVMPVLGVVMVAGQIVGELLTDERILARHKHAKELRRLRAQTGL